MLNDEYIDVIAETIVDEDIEKERLIDIISRFWSHQFQEVYDADMLAELIRNIIYFQDLRVAILNVIFTIMDKHKLRLSNNIRNYLSKLTMKQAYSLLTIDPYDLIIQLKRLDNYQKKE